MKQSQISPDILEAYGLGEPTSVSMLESGHINGTFLVETPSQKLLFQRMNRFVFPHPQNIMKNIVAVTEFLRKKVTAKGGNPDREVLTIVNDRSGSSFYQDKEGEFWRCMLYIEDTTCEAVGQAALLREAGRAFGEFQNMLSDYPADTLFEIIPNFHNTPERYRQLEAAIEKNFSNRIEQCAAELAFAAARKADCSLLVRLQEKWVLPTRVTHNDTKLSNILFDQKTGKAVCVIDLDTVMPGLSAFDFGDSIRAAASTAEEDERDLSKVNFDLSLFEAYSEGFLSTAGKSLTKKELEVLPDGARLMTFEVGIRFLADYLNGDVYFRTAYPEHNLVRAKNQFKLVHELEENDQSMRDIIERLMQNI